MVDVDQNNSAQSVATAAHRDNRRPFLRIAFLILLLVAILAALAFFLLSPHGRELLNREHLRQLGPHVRRTVERHPLLAPLLFVAAYVVLAVLVLPVWWLQILAGFGFGIVVGVFW